MANYASFQTTSDNAADTVAEAAQARNTPAAAPSVQTSRKVQVDTFGDGRQAAKDLSARTVTTERQVRPGNVIIPGVGETTIEAARLAGLLPPGFDGPAGGKSAAPAGNQQGAQQQGQSDAPEGSTDGDATDLAAAVMETLAGALGADAVESGIWQAAETGDVEGSIPAGVTDDAVDAIVEGFTAQANAVLKALPAGVASVDMLMETLNDGELREARMATINNDREKLAHLGRTALGRMETLPYQDPAAFDTLIADMPANERKALSFNEERGEWVVKVPGRQAMSFGAAVRAGIVRVG
ncbi:MAG: hypothetical protein EOR30_16865 [Mesorhizobium sp.]|uniref:hypothetical protein n=1 Tax=unclassified Mesorhizobium TaxID=325217 RepID=UPI000FCCCD53|nr:MULTISPECIES: hypothetical protein [unclassified Mesorhizobium]RUV75959.1 hypothetical protein EOA78_04990 [Mesorhizobium sp. M5C.F.Cr.IN.023.01.1.1]RWF85756.1 MAG: hypothetical protein EOQ36_20825 [Mesorhizobium sp.]RWF95252.1 MAG: hypothetical protein EOQ45_07925 [Mesorhizobium sp.]RWI39914.1 MAG: hypothetical protein EOR14_17720 [Mesorhizobium sp.]RWI45222.1 MAG: hypothetical protein EOR15_22320 [Mesorhizobium sp.]